MSEYALKIVLCDRCYPDDLPGFTFFPLEIVRGVYRGTMESAEAEGWLTVDYGQICPDCARLEADQAGEDGEVVLGQMALESVTGAQDDT